MAKLIGRQNLPLPVRHMGRGYIVWQGVHYFFFSGEQNAGTRARALHPREGGSAQPVPSPNFFVVSKARRGGGRGQWVSPPSLSRQHFFDREQNSGGRGGGECGRVSGNRKTLGRGIKDPECITSPFVPHHAESFFPPAAPDLLAVRPPSPSPWAGMPMISPVDPIPFLNTRSFE